MTMEEYIDRMEISELIDKCAVAVDKGDYEAAADCFTENAANNGYDETGKEAFNYSGKDEIKKGFKDLLSPYATPYHVNGQKIITLDGDKASAQVYCQDFYVVRYKSGIGSTVHQGCVYADTYEKVDGKWLISSRTVKTAWKEER